MYRTTSRRVPKLTINAGLRYELVTPQFVTGNHLANFDPATNTLIQASSGSIYKRALVHTPTLGFAPRFGFAYQLTPKTVVRSAYGISFDQFNREGGENLLAYNGPYIVNSSITQVAPFTVQARTSRSRYAPETTTSNCFRTVQQGYPLNFASLGTLQHTAGADTLYPKNIPTGYVQTWHLDVQREIMKNTVLTTSYIGEHGVHIWVLADLNQAANALTKCHTELRR